MNNQVNYIVYGVLNLIVFGGIFILVSKIPKDLILKEPQNEFFCGTSNTVKPLSENARWGKMLFMSKCASCHQIFKDATGPSLAAAINSGKWDDRQKLYAWIRNPAEFMKTDSYTRGLKEKFGSMMTGFPDITDQEVDAIVEYIQSFPGY